MTLKLFLSQQKAKVDYKTSQYKITSYKFYLQNRAEEQQQKKKEPLPRVWESAADILPVKKLNLLKF